MLESKILDVINQTRHRKNNANNTINVLLTSYFPVALKLRPAGLYRLDEFSHEIDDISPEEKSIADKLGLALVPWSTLNDRLQPKYHWYFVISKDNSDSEEQIRTLLYSMYDIIESVGRILDYPKCCVKSAADDAMIGLVSDRRATEHVNLYKSQNRKIDSLVYYTWGLIPCKPNCSKALEKGRIIYSAYKKINPGIAKTYKAVCKNWIEVMGRVAQEPAEKLFISVDKI